MRILIVFLLVAGLTACGQAEYAYPGGGHSDPEQIMRYVIRNVYQVDGKPVTGVVYTYYGTSEASQRGLEVELQNGLLHGHVKVWWRNGQLMLKAEGYAQGAGDPGLVDDIRWVSWREWDSDGSLERVRKYDDQGNPVVKKVWGDDGKLYRVKKYRDSGVLASHTEWCHDTQGKQKRSQLVFQEPTDDGAAHATQTVWSCKTGHKTSVRHMVYANIEDMASSEVISVGTVRKWYPDGDPLAVQHYNEQGEQVGIWKSWTEDGTLRLLSYRHDAFVADEYIRQYTKALENGDLETVKYFFKKGVAAPGLKIGRERGWPKREWTYPIVIASQNVARFLLKKGADINAQASDGTTALLRCASGIFAGDCSIDELRFLLEHGADPTITDDAGHTALHRLAMSKGSALLEEGGPQRQIKAFKLLMAAGAPLNAQDNEGQTVLIYALANRRAELVKTILEYDPDVSLTNQYGQKAIHYVFLRSPRRISYRDNEFTRSMLKLLVQEGANVDATFKWDGQPKTLSEIAMHFGSVSLAKYIDSLGEGA